jgi:virginiamycin A acetyltransferase
MGKAVSTYPFAELFKIDYPLCDRAGTVEIGNDVWIGKGVTIIQGNAIGDGAIVGAGAVIAKDVPPYAVVVGNPFVIKRYRFSPEIIAALLTIQWWNWPEEFIRARIADFNDIDVFAGKYLNG